MTRYTKNREFMKANFEVLDSIKTDKQKGLPTPAITKEKKENCVEVKLPEAKESQLTNNSLFNCLDERRSYRRFSDKTITLEDLSFMLWSTAQIQKVRDNGGGTLRRVPSGGASHTIETYLIINNVEGLEKGVYHYSPLDHSLVCINKVDALEEIVDEATPRQPYAPHFVCKSPVIFAWTSIPYRAEYKFDLTAHKKILFDAGHLCQNLYLACEAIGCGSCAVGIYDQVRMDELLQVDGEEEFTIYLSAVGGKPVK